MLTIVNLTPHTINVVGCEPIVASGQEARVSVGYTPTSVAGCEIPLAYEEAGEIVGLPEFDPNGLETLYIVSTQIRRAMPNRYDLASPGELLRGPDGQPVGCARLVLNKPLW